MDLSNQIITEITVEKPDETTMMPIDESTDDRYKAFLREINAALSQVNATQKALQEMMDTQDPIIKKLLKLLDEAKSHTTQLLDQKVQLTQEDSHALVDVFEQINQQLEVHKNDLIQSRLNGQTTTITDVLQNYEQQNQDKTLDSTSLVQRLHDLGIADIENFIVSQSARTSQFAGTSTGLGALASLIDPSAAQLLNAVSDPVSKLLSDMKFTKSTKKDKPTSTTEVAADHIVDRVPTSDDSSVIVEKLDQISDYLAYQIKDEDDEDELEDRHHKELLDAMEGKSESTDLDSGLFDGISSKLKGLMPALGTAFAGVAAFSIGVGLGKLITQSEWYKKIEKSIIDFMIPDYDQSEGKESVIKATELQDKGLLSPYEASRLSDSEINELYDVSQGKGHAASLGISYQQVREQMIQDKGWSTEDIKNSESLWKSLKSEPPVESVSSVTTQSEITKNKELRNNSNLVQDTNSALKEVSNIIKETTNNNTQPIVINNAPSELSRPNIPSDTSLIALTGSGL